MKINNQKDLIHLLETAFPLKSQEAWDFSGFSFISKKEKPLKLLICLDVDKQTILRAIKEDVSLILSHHPFCFASSQLEAIELDSNKKELFDLLNKNNISAYSIHTPFDIHPMGTHYYLLKRLGLLNKKAKQYKFSTVVEYSSSFESLVKLLKEKLGLDYTISNWSKPLDSKINKVYFAPGAGDIYEFIEYNKKENCDLLVTSDIKWNEQVVLQNLNLNFMIVSHKIEEVFNEGIYEFINGKLNDDVKVILDYKKDYLKKY